MTVSARSAATVRSTLDSATTLKLENLMAMPKTARKNAASTIRETTAAAAAAVTAPKVRAPRKAKVTADTLTQDDRDRIAVAAVAVAERMLADAATMTDPKRAKLAYGKAADAVEIANKRAAEAGTSTPFPAQPAVAPVKAHVANTADERKTAALLKASATRVANLRKSGENDAADAPKPVVAPVKRPTAAAVRKAAKAVADAAIAKKMFEDAAAATEMEEEVAREAALAPKPVTRYAKAKAARAAKAEAASAAAAAATADAPVTPKVRSTRKAAAAATVAPAPVKTPAAPKVAKVAKPKFAKAKAVAFAAVDHPKVVALINYAFAQGWATDTQLIGLAAVLFSADRNSEKLTVTFIDGKLDLDRMPTYVRVDGSTVLLRNVSAVKKQMDSDPAARPVKSARTTVKKVAKIDGEEPQRSLSFDPATATNEEIAEIIAGSPLRWRRSDGSVDEAIAGPKVTVSTHPVKPGMSHRVVTFFELVESEKRGVVSGPERHVGLDSLLTVGR